MVSIERLRAHPENKTKQARQRDCELAADEIESLRKDSKRLEFLYGGTKTGSNALVAAEMRLLNGETLTLCEARAAIDEAMRTPPVLAVGAV